MEILFQLLDEIDDSLMLAHERWLTHFIRAAERAALARYAFPIILGIAAICPLTASSTPILF